MKPNTYEIADLIALIMEHYCIPIEEKNLKEMFENLHNRNLVTEQELNFINVTYS